MCMALLVTADHNRTSSKPPANLACRVRQNRWIVFSKKYGGGGGYDDDDDDDDDNDDDDNDDDDDDDDDDNDDGGGGGGRSMSIIIDHMYTRYVGFLFTL